MKTCPTCNATNEPNATICTACGSALPTTVSAPPTSALPRNTRLKNGAFAIGEVLGQGGFGITYKGGDLGLKRYVAIKEFFPHGAQRVGKSLVPPRGVSEADFALARQNFLKEATLLARFDHPGIVRVFGVWEENHTAYMVMELLEGESLQSRLDSKGVMSEAEALEIIKAVGQALSQVHERGLLHRDIKPDNILITQDNRVVLIDFGTAREFSADKTRAMTAMVTAGYAPLEQYGKQAKFGPYTDVYALGATLYHCLTGALPTSVMDRVAGVELPAPDQVNQYVSRGVSAATMQALEIKAADRFQSVQKFIVALDAPVSQTTQSPVSVPQHTPPPLMVPPSFDVPNSAPPQRRSCVHCGSLMPATEGKCPFCLKSEYEPLETKADTVFDRVMFAIPSMVWHALGVAIVALLLGRIGLGMVRYQNGGRDYGTELARDVMKNPKTSELSKATLQLGEGIYDEDALVKRSNNYEGKVRYRDGDVGTLQLTVTARDWLYRPDAFEFSYRPYDFGSQLASELRAKINARARAENVDLKATNITLSRQTRTLYQGSIVFVDDPKNRLGVTVIVDSFDNEGAPDGWHTESD